ncbi:uncharacterized protein LOC122638994 [Telopea speciosissima]|uniref:uncharacterized protein LOC122638994 n=1 Tax=Telopea speciosissima TaxID=54955 RepID=UPI001CC70CC7|nr:uncharacterized protein LOC122638994 [Telopea speciosissima]
MRGEAEDTGESGTTGGDRMVFCAGTGFPLKNKIVGFDGRFFLGVFHCIDKQHSIILQDAVEYRSTRCFSPSPMEQRCLGLILIPSSCRSSCHVDCSIDKQLSLLSLENSINNTFR